MSTTSRTMQTGEDMVMHHGSALLRNTFPKRDFTLADPAVRDAYEKTYYCFAARLPDYRFHPFSAEGARSPGELNIDPNKGMLLMGNTGVGMTTLFKVMAGIFLHTERTIEMVNLMDFTCEVASINSRNKDQVYTSPNLRQPVYTGFTELLNMYGRCLFKDLLIDETEIFKSIDQHSPIVKGLIYQREEVFPHYKTHLCISFDEGGDNPEQYAREALLKAYGEHVYSRINSMFNLVVWQGESFRTGK